MISLSASILLVISTGVPTTTSGVFDGPSCWCPRQGGSSTSPLYRWIRVETSWAIALGRCRLSWKLTLYRLDYQRRLSQYFSPPHIYLRDCWGLWNKKLGILLVSWRYWQRNAGRGADYDRTTQILFEYPHIWPLMDLAYIPCRFEILEKGHHQHGFLTVEGMALFFNYCLILHPV